MRGHPSVIGGALKSLPLEAAIAAKGLSARVRRAPTGGCWLSWEIPLASAINVGVAAAMVIGSYSSHLANRQFAAPVASPVVQAAITQLATTRVLTIWKVLSGALLLSSEPFAASF